MTNKRLPTSSAVARAKLATNVRAAVLINHAKALERARARRRLIEVLKKADATLYRVEAITQVLFDRIQRLVREIEIDISQALKDEEE